MQFEEIHIRDPFILPWEGSYYLYGTRGANAWKASPGIGYGFDCYVSNDLVEWEGPYEVFHASDEFWADRDFWAPEVHVFCGGFYLFASFKSVNRRRGTQVLRADSPLGPFSPHSEGPLTPADWESLDGTLYVEGNTPYLIFCHEWLQVHDGEMCCVQLAPDLRRAVSKPQVLFHASDAPWVVPVETGSNNYVTDGPWLHRSRDGDLLMLWSSFCQQGYCQNVARSLSGTILGPWEQQKALFEKDGGHGMLFHSFDGRLFLALHSPNQTPLERPVLHLLHEEAGSLALC
jgi:arabinan endo-1,5-alpha-L-arabinosidase